MKSEIMLQSMKVFSFIVVSLFFYIQSPLVSGKVWIGKDPSGIIITEKDLKEILQHHEIWVKTHGKKKCRATLEGADLKGANLTKAYLPYASLKKSFFGNANLKNAILKDADLQDAKLRWTHLEGTNLSGANLKGAKLRGANLKKANLTFANLQRANLWEANLKGANLKGASLEEARLFKANLLNTTLELQPTKIPHIQSLSTAKHLSSLKYELSPHTLIELQTAFYDAGLRKQEREITYAIHHNKIEKMRINGNPIEYYANLILFELTCEWGLTPLRPILIMFILILIFSVYYIKVLRVENKDDGIWRIWFQSRTRKDLGQNEPELLTMDLKSSLIFGFYFSFLSAFHVGWREINVGNWLSKMQHQEYALRATGWTRTISSIQSLLSVYLLALSVLTYFGRPFG